MALPLGLAALCIGLLLAGVGSRIQHPRASLLVAGSYGSAARGPLGIHNFAGDLGKVAFPALAAVLLPFLAWREIVGVMAVVGVLVAFALMARLPRQTIAASAGNAPDAASNAVGGDGRGFNLLMAIGGLDTATRMGYLLFLPFLLQAKGGTEATLGIGLALLFAGGALGKACCGWVGQHLGVTWSVIATETTTAVLAVATLMLPLAATLMLLPLLGIVLNGTSSVLYGTVPELARRGEVGKAFAWFYTAVIGVGGLAPIVYGALADRSSIATGVIATALTAIAVIGFRSASFLHEGRARPSVGAQ
jgi:MFS transporter, FSR family, fosmidomycin resistance protein